MSLILYNTESEWIAANKNFYSWYFETYPFLKNIGLPVKTSTLLGFYNRDMEVRNFKPVPAIQQSYDLLFSYFIANYPDKDDPNRFKGKTTLEYVIENIPKGFEMTANQLTSGVSSISKTVIYLFVAVILFIILLKFKI